MFAVLESVVGVEIIGVLAPYGWNVLARHETAG
jgi:hypothetical protein